MSNKELIRDTRERVISLEVKVDMINRKLDMLPCPAYEDRIGILENWRGKVMVVAGIVSMFISLFIAFLRSKLFV
ncbi:MAG: hypothetical protein GF411_15275 [Candidatus Lokiarchaeota archaeon]|nr:hypothetical protein [Candidatus Lokiarchaeota archaeon]